MEVEIIRGDICALDVDVLVNAANPGLRGGGGVDGAIHKAAGPKLLEACRALGGCPTGEARMTEGFSLQARYVIHAVGPIYIDGLSGEPEALEAAYRNACVLVVKHELRSVAFSALSTGVYGYPIQPASRIAVNTVFDAFCDTGIRVVFSAFNQEVERSLLEALDERTGSSEKRG